MKRSSITAKRFDEIFDTGEEDITPYLDLSKGKRAGLEQKRVNVDFPKWIVEALDREAARIGVTRQSIIKTWVADRLTTSLD